MGTTDSLHLFILQIHGRITPQTIAVLDRQSPTHGGRVLLGRISRRMRLLARRHPLSPVETAARVWFRTRHPLILHHGHRANHSGRVLFLPTLLRDAKAFRPGKQVLIQAALNNQIIFVQRASIMNQMALVVQNILQMRGMQRPSLSSRLQVRLPTTI